MEPSYHNLQFALLDKYTDRFENGDVIAFFCEGLDAVLVKRIVATPNETVRISNGTLYVNGNASAEFVQPGTITDGGIASEEIHLDEDEFFVLGDNLPQSIDSRHKTVGPVDQQHIIGKVIFP